MAKNNRNKRLKERQQYSRYRPVLAGKGSFDDPVRQDVINQLRKNKALLKGSKSSDNALGNKPKGLQLALDFFSKNPNESDIAGFTKKHPTIMKDAAVQESILARMTDPSQVGAFARGIGSVVKGFGMESKAVQSKLTQIIQGGDYEATDPTPADLGQQVPPSNSNVYKNIYIPPSGSQSSGKKYRPVVPPINDGISQQALNGNTPPTSIAEQQALNGGAPTVDPTGFAPVGVSRGISTGLPPVLADVGGNASNTLNGSNLAIQNPNQGLQFNGLGITNPADANSQANAIPALNNIAARPSSAVPPTKDNGFSFTRASMFGDDKNIGWLTGGAQVATGVMGIYNGYKATKLAREQYELKKNTYKLDYRNQAQLLNRDILRTEKNFAAIRNSGTPVTDRKAYYDTIDRQGNKAYQKNKLNVNAADNF